MRWWRTFSRYPNGAWLVAISTVLEDASLQLENLFECVMVLPGTDFRLSRSTIYSPSKFNIWTSFGWENNYLPSGQPAVLARSNTFSGSSTNLIGGSSLMMVTMIIFIISVKFSVWPTWYQRETVIQSLILVISYLNLPLFSSGQSDNDLNKS